MKRIIFTAVLTLIIGLGGIQAKQAHPAIHHLQREQMADIRSGVRSGELNQQEARKLMQEQHKINKQLKRAEADGYLSASERKSIMKHQRKAEAHIKHEKNDRNYGR